MLPVKIQDNRVHVGMRFSVSFQRTDRISQGAPMRRPVSLGLLPVRLASNLPCKLSPGYSNVTCVIVPCDEDEAVWLGFSGENAHSVALKIRQGAVNAITGGDWDESLHHPQDYLMPPGQTSWYGIPSSEGHTRQFSSDPIELVVYEPKQPVGPTIPSRTNWDKAFYSAEDNRHIHPETTNFIVVPDPHGITFWSSEPSGRVSVYFVNSENWRSLTGEDAPKRDSEYGGWLLP